MGSFADTNHFIELQEHTPPLIEKSEEVPFTEEGVRSVPFGSSLERDYIPSDRTKLGLSAPPAQRKEERVEVHYGERDHLSGEETARQQVVRQKLVDQAAANIMKEYEDSNSRYHRALRYVEKFDALAEEGQDLPKEVLERLLKAKKRVEKGVPMTLERAKEQAINRLLHN